MAVVEKLAGKINIKIAKTIGNTDLYTDGVTNNSTDNGTVVFTIPKGAPDILYYACANHQSMQGIFEIKDAVDELNIDIPTEVLGKTEYTSSSGVVFTNGLKIIMLKVLEQELHLLL